MKKKKIPLHHQEKREDDDYLGKINNILPPFFSSWPVNNFLCKEVGIEVVSLC